MDLPDHYPFAAELKAKWSAAKAWEAEGKQIRRKRAGVASDASGLPRVVVVVKGGVVQSVFADQPVEFLRKDFDNIEAGDAIGMDDFAPAQLFSDPEQFKEQVLIDVPVSLRRISPRY